MAIAKVADRGSTQDIIGTGTTTVLVTGTTTVGNYAIARVAVDNSGGGGQRPGLDVTDARSNTWTVGTGGLADPGTASSGIACYIAYALITTALVTSDLITFTWGSGNPVAKAVVVEEWSGIDDISPVATAETNTSGAGTTPSISRTPAASGNLFYGVLGVEGPTGDTVTADADTTEGSWVTLTRLSTTHATAVSNATVNGAYKLVTGIADQTWNPTITSRDWAQAALVFAERAPRLGQATLSGAGAATATAERTVVVTAALSGIGDLSAAGFVPMDPGPYGTFSFGTMPYGMVLVEEVGAVTHNAAAILAGVGALDAAALRTAMSAAALSGIGALDAAGARTAVVIATLSGTGTLTAAALRTLFGTAALSGVGALDAAAVRTLFGTAVLSGVGGLDAAAFNTALAVAALSGTGTLSGAAVRTLFGTAVLAGTGSLDAAAFNTAMALAALSGAGSLVAVGTIVGGTDGTFHVWTGSAWVKKPVNVWNGSAWVTFDLKFWNGSTWITSA